MRWIRPALPTSCTLPAGHTQGMITSPGIPPVPLIPAMHLEELTLCGDVSSYVSVQGVKGTGCVLCEYAGGRQAECCLCCRSPRTGWAAADLLSLGCSCFPSAAIAVICISPALIEMLLSSSHQHHPPCTAASPPFPICSLLHHHICVSGGCPGEGELYIAATQCAGDIWRHGGVSSWQSQTYHSCTAGIIGNVTSL